MSSHGHFNSRFESLLHGSKQQAVFCITVILVWLMHIDGRASPDEEELLKAFRKAHAQEPRFFHDLLAPSGPAQERQAALHLTLEVILELVDRSQLPALLELLVSMTLADGYLTVAENHALRFLADVFGLGPHGLQNAFQKMTGRPLPQPSDPSRRQWWEERERSARGRSQTASNQTRNPQQNVQRVKALATLGLDDPVTPEEIKAAYRRMCKVHHPDRFASFGEEAVQTANNMIRRIRKAYEYLESTS